MRCTVFVRRWVAVATLLLLASCSRRETVYSTDIEEGKVLPALTQAINPLGNCGDVEKVLDLRGFVPISLPSQYRTKHMRELGTDTFQYYQAPTREAIAAICYGQNYEGQLAATPIVSESQLADQDLEWAKAAYAFTSLDNGEVAFASLVGGGGYNDGAPVAVILAPESAFLILNYRWTGIDRHGTGQSLFALEFSRRVRGLRGIYPLYTNGFVTKQTGAAMDDLSKIATAAFAMP